MMINFVYLIKQKLEKGKCNKLDEVKIKKKMKDR